MPTFRSLPAAVLGLTVVATAPSVDAQGSVEVSGTASAGASVMAVAPVLSARS